MPTPKEIEMLVETIRHTTVYKDLGRLDRSISDQRRQELLDLVVNTAMVYHGNGYRKAAIDRANGQYKI